MELPSWCLTAGITRFIDMKGSDIYEDISSIFYQQHSVNGVINTPRTKGNIQLFRNIHFRLDKDNYCISLCISPAKLQSFHNIIVDVFIKAKYLMWDIQILLRCKLSCSPIPVQRIKVNKKCYQLFHCWDLDLKYGF